MVTLIAGGLFLGLIIVALYFFGAFKSPYLGLPYFWLFRFALMLLLMWLMATLWQSERERAYEGSDPPVNQREAR
ncbi:MAG: hypothetical protein A4E19_20070 [Nitrospira sp. SG-bin1]|nr:MAG: hypothetical protein A4E19_20070 [Nitrospira sp. SG-bin1]